MIELLSFPFDHNKIIRKKKKIKKELLNLKNNANSVKIAILGGSTTSEIKDILELFLLNENLNPIFYESGYNKYFEEIMFENNLEKFNPDIIFIHTSFRNIMNLPNIIDDINMVESKINEIYIKYETLWDTIQKKYNCIIIQNNFEYPQFRLLSNSDCSDNRGYIYFVNELNKKFTKYKNENNNFYINDINYISSNIGLMRWYDNNIWFNYKYAMSFEGIVYLCKSISNIIKSLYGKDKKCLLLDLDNTLWYGVIGDDGINKINMSIGNAIGESYRYFQDYILNLNSKGVQLAIVSKNNYETAMQGLKHYDMIIDVDKFISKKINWNHKFINIQEISNEISLGLDSFVFIDDNETERESIKFQLPQVTVPNIGNDVVKYINYIELNGYFEYSNISQEDKLRNKYYKDNEKRNNELVNFSDYNDFLKSLNMIAEISNFKEIYLERITQLINKTNQFNLTSKRMSLEEVKNIYYSKNRINIYCRLKDKFGDNGLISVISGYIENDSLFIDLWLMSCRVIKKDVEKAMFDELIKICKQNNIKYINAYYLKTPKNALVENHYDKLGFDSEYSDDKIKEYKIIVNNINYNLNKNIIIGEY